MRKNAIFTAPWTVHVAIVLLAAVMLLPAAVSCGRSADTISRAAQNDTYVFENPATEKALVSFLDYFSKWYAASPHGDWKYDCASAAGGKGNILACIAASNACADWTLYSDKSFEDRFVEKANDPRGWALQSNCYYVFDAKTVEFIAHEIFNVSKNDIDKLTQNGELNRLFYKQNQNYYTLSDENLRSLVDVSSVSVKDNGDRYTVSFIVNGACDLNDEGTVMVVYRKCTAEMGLKSIDGSEYWSLYQFDSEES